MKTSNVHTYHSTFFSPEHAARDWYGVVKELIIHNAIFPTRHSTVPLLYTQAQFLMAKSIRMHSIFPREVVEVLSFETFKTTLDEALESHEFMFPNPQDRTWPNGCFSVL